MRTIINVRINFDKDSKKWSLWFMYFDGRVYGTERKEFDSLGSACGYLLVYPERDNYDE